METAEKKRSYKKGLGGKRKRFDFATRLSAVKLYVEDGHPLGVVCSECGVSKNSLCRWVQDYRKGGSAALKYERKTGKRQALPEAVSEKIVEIKKNHI